MKKTSKKMWSIVLALVMALTMIPLSAFAEDYEIWVGGTQITDANQDDVLGDGKVSYNPQAGILTLNGATINGADIEGTNHTAGIYSTKFLKIELIGDNTITGTEAEGSSLGIHVGDSELKMVKSLGVFGEGSLTITAGNSTVEGNSEAISAHEFTLYSGTVHANAGTATKGYSNGVWAKKLFIEGGTLTAKGESQAIYAEPNEFSDDYKVEVAEDTTSGLGDWDKQDVLFGNGSKFKQIKISPATTIYPIWISRVQVTDNNKADVLGDGKVVYDPAQKKLTLNGANIESNETYGIWSYLDLTIELQGDNTISLTEISGNKYGIEILDQASTNTKDLTITGAGNLEINTGDSNEGELTGIYAKNITIDSTGEIFFKPGVAQGDNDAIYAYGSFIQNHGVVSAIAGKGKNSYGIRAGEITLADDASIFAAGHTKALSGEITVNVTDPSIVASELYDSGLNPVKIDKAEANKLAGVTPVYKTVSIMPATKLKQGLKVDVVPTEGATVMVKKQGDVEFKNSLDGLTEDDIIEVKVDVKDSKKELDKVIVSRIAAEDDIYTEEMSMSEKTFGMWPQNVKVQAVLKNKPVAPSTGGGGTSGRSSVRPESTTASAKPQEPTTTQIPDNEVRLVIGSATMQKGKDSVMMDAVPFVKDGRTMVPLRYIGEALGLKVSWNAQTKTATLSTDDKEIVIPTNSLTMKMNDKAVQSDVLPVLQGGRVYLSISNIGKALGLEQGKDIKWDAETKTVTIVLPGK